MSPPAAVELRSVFSASSSNRTLPGLGTGPIQCPNRRISGCVSPHICPYVSVRSGMQTALECGIRKTDGSPSPCIAPRRSAVRIRLPPLSSSLQMGVFVTIITCFAAKTSATLWQMWGHFLGNRARIRGGIRAHPRVPAGILQGITAPPIRLHRPDSGVLARTERVPCRPPLNWR